MLSKWVMVVAVVVPLVGSVSEARADKKSEAREFFQEGSRQYDLGEYNEALKAFKSAYLKLEDPIFLFNIAQCHRQLGQKLEAVKFYRTYLRKVPSAETRPQVEKIVADLEASITLEKATRSSPPQGTVSPEKSAVVEPTPPPAPAPVVTPQPTAPAFSEADRRTGRTLKISGLAVGGFGILALAAGGGFVAGAHSANDDVVATGTFDRSAQDRRDTFQALDIAFFAIGAAALVAGTTLFLLGRRNEHKVSALPSVGPSRASLDLTVRF